MVLHGRLVPEVAQILGIGENLIYKWKSHSNPLIKTTVTTSNAAQVQPAGLAEQQALHKRIRELETERDIRLRRKL